MKADVFKDWLPVGALIVAFVALIWNVTSWRRAGSRLRVHALLYREVLVLWIFNAGRTSVQVERVVLGGFRAGIRGYELTAHLKTPIVLAPGMSYRDGLPWKELGLSPEAKRSALAGWQSVWLLLGSMQQKRVELLPIAHDYPPEVGWVLAPRGANLTRYLALATCVPVIYVAWAGIDMQYAKLAVLGLWMVGVMGFDSAMGRSSRGRFEVGCIVFGAVIANLIYLGRLHSFEFHWAVWVVAGYIVMASFLAVPGFMADVYQLSLFVRSKYRQRRG